MISASLKTHKQISNQEQFLQIIDSIIHREGSIIMMEEIFEVFSNAIQVRPIEQGIVDYGLKYAMGVLEMRDVDQMDHMINACAMIGGMLVNLRDTNLMDGKIGEVVGMVMGQFESGDGNYYMPSIVHTIACSLCYNPILTISALTHTPIQNPLQQFFIAFQS